jgi:hypothetical protein
MSDSWQGPGWRQGPDGKWYPTEELPATPTPHLPPGADPAGPPPPASASPPPPGDIWSQPPPSPPGPSPALQPQGDPSALLPRSVSPALAIALQVMFWAAGVGALVVAATALLAKSAFADYWGSGTRSAYDGWVDADMVLGVVTLLNLAVDVGLLVVLIVWAWQAHRTTSWLSPGPRRWGVGWTIGGWFIPCASIVIPKLVLTETERIARQPGPRSSAADLKRVSVSLVGSFWWWLYVASNLLSARLSFTQGDLSGSATLDSGSIHLTYTLQALGSGVAAVSAVLGALYVRDISRRLSPDGVVALLPRSTVGIAAAPGLGGLTVAGTPASSVDLWAQRTAAADTFCEICREPLAATTPRCPRCGKRRKVTASG